MLTIEKLSLFNIDIFRKLYKENENSYICDKNFFEVYDTESFIIRYMMRKQVKLFKADEKYIGYVWYEYPPDNDMSSIYAIYVMDKYISYLSPSLLNALKCKNLKADIIENSKNEETMHDLSFNILTKTSLMKLSYDSTNDFSICDDLQFKHFKKNRDEKLRLEIQNTIFNDKKRIPLTIDDIYQEEQEDYYIDGFSVFLYKNCSHAIGYGQIIFNKSLYTIVNFGIIEEYRGNGYGEILLRYLIALCRSNSINDIYIRVEKDNFKAVSLYKKVGFKECGSYVTWIKNFVI